MREGATWNRGSVATLTAPSTPHEEVPTVSRGGVACLQLLTVPGPKHTFAQLADPCRGVLLARRTALGMFVESIGANPSAARHSGVPTRLVLVLVYGACGLLAGAAGLVAAADIRAADANAW